MHIEEFKRRLGEKLDTQDKFYTLLKEAGVHDVGLPCKVEDKFSGSYTVDYVSGPYPSCRAVGNFRAARWWQARESLRMAMLYALVPWDYIGMRAVPNAVCFPHISLKDPTRLAYTASIEDGERDVQRTVTLPRFLRSQTAYWTLPDEDFAKAEAALQAELQAELLILPSEFIPLVYENGPASCMKYAEYRGKYWKPEQLGCHVTEPFVGIPGIRIAVTRNADGSGFSQRAMLWENPEYPNDKRYIRIYGSGPLNRRLERHGYKKGNLVGAKLKFIKATISDSDEYPLAVLPYLDSEGSSNSGEGVILVDNELVIVDSDTRQRLSGAGFALDTTSHTQGYVTLRRYKAEDLEWTDSEGVKHSYLDCAPIQVMTEEGEFKNVRSDMLGSQYVQRCTAIDGTAIRVYMAQSAPYFFLGGCQWWDTDANRAHCGHVKLAEELYSDRSWHHERNTSKTFDGKVIRDEDVCRLYQEDLTYLTAHKDHVPDRKKYKRVRMVGGLPALVKRTMEVVEVTGRNNRKITGIPGIHPEIVTALNGKYYVGSAVSSFRLLNKNYSIPHNWEGVKFTEEVALHVKDWIREEGASDPHTSARHTLRGLRGYRTSLPWWFSSAASMDPPESNFAETLKPLLEVNCPEHAGCPEQHDFFKAIMQTVYNELVQIENEHNQAQSQESEPASATSSSPSVEPVEGFSASVASVTNLDNLAVYSVAA